MHIDFYNFLCVKFRRSLFEIPSDMINVIEHKNQISGDGGETIRDIKLKRGTRTIWQKPNPRVTASVLTYI